MKLALVIYGADERQRRRMASFTKRWQFELLLLNNRLEHEVEGALAGDNSHFEFSAYLKACRQLQGEGPFVIANDTLFKNHYPVGWGLLLTRALARLPLHEQSVWGDIRRDGSALAERPDPFLASWIFVLPNRAALGTFEQALSEILQKPLLPPSEAYQVFLNAWTMQGGWFSGWHGEPSPSELARKQYAIRLEHALSKALSANQLPIKSLGELVPILYFSLRIIDRLRTRWLAITSRFSFKNKR